MDPCQTECVLFFDSFYWTNGHVIGTEMIQKFVNGFFFIGWFCASVVITYSLCGVMRIYRTR